MLNYMNSSFQIGISDENVSTFISDIEIINEMIYRYRTPLPDGIISLDGDARFNMSIELENRIEAKLRGCIRIRYIR